MKNSYRSLIYEAVFAMLKPIAKILMRNSVGARDFCELAKTAFVDVARETYGLRGRPTNVSRMAVITGLTRKELDRIRTKLNDGQPLEMPKTSVVDRLLKQWTSDLNYLDSSGKPKSLPFDDHLPSFSDLVNQASSDIPPGAMRTELIRTGAVVTQKDGSLAVQHDELPLNDDVNDIVAAFTGSIEPVCQCVLNNLEAEKDDQRWPALAIQSPPLRGKDALRFRSVSNKYMKKLAAEMTTLFSAYETLHSDEHSRAGDFNVEIKIFHTETAKA